MHTTIMSALTTQTGAKNTALPAGQSYKATGNLAAFLSVLEEHADQAAKAGSDAPTEGQTEAENDAATEADIKSSQTEKPEGNQSDQGFDSLSTTQSANENRGTSNPEAVGKSSHTNETPLAGREAGQTLVTRPGDPANAPSHSQNSAKPSNTLSTNGQISNSHADHSVVNADLGQHINSVVRDGVGIEGAGKPTSKLSSGTTDNATADKKRGTTAQQFVAAAMVQELVYQNQSKAGLAPSENRQHQIDFGQLPHKTSTKAESANDRTIFAGQFAKTADQTHGGFPFAGASVSSSVRIAPDGSVPMDGIRADALPDPQTPHPKGSRDIPLSDAKYLPQSGQMTLQELAAQSSGQTAQRPSTATAHYSTAVSSDAPSITTGKPVPDIGNTPDGPIQVENELQGANEPAARLAHSKQNEGVAQQNGTSPLTHRSAATEATQVLPQTGSSLSATVTAEGQERDPRHGILPNPSHQLTRNGPSINANMSKPAIPLLQSTTSALPLASSRFQEPIEEIVWDVRAQNSTATSVSPNPNVLRPEMPNHIAHQLAQAVYRHPDRAVEIALNPAELGRVRMTLSTKESGLVVSIFADRPDTLDLMRRNINELSESFADLGYEDIDFAFGENETHTDSSHQDQPARAGNSGLDLGEHASSETASPDTPRLKVSGEGIDLRL